MVKQGKKGRSGQEAEENTNGWMTTYSDMMTLLFAFFVLLFAISNVDAQKFSLLSAALSRDGITPEKMMEIQQMYDIDGDRNMDLDNPLAEPPPGESEIVEPNPVLAAAAEKLEEALAANGQSDMAVVTVGGNYLFITFTSDLMFAPDSATILPETKNLIDIIGTTVGEIQDDIKIVRIDGHTASIPGVTNYHISDRVLSADRANSVLSYFENELGYPAVKLVAVGWGDTRPVADNATPEGRAKNRRVEIFISTEDLPGMNLSELVEQS